VLTDCLTVTDYPMPKQDYRVVQQAQSEHECAKYLFDSQAD
jgi:hypothetical protein